MRNPVMVQAARLDKMARHEKCTEGDKPTPEFAIQENPVVMYEGKVLHGWGDILAMRARDMLECTAVRIDDIDDQDMLERTIKGGCEVLRNHDWRKERRKANKPCATFIPDDAKATKGGEE